AVARKLCSGVDGVAFHVPVSRAVETCGTEQLIALRPGSRAVLLRGASHASEHRRRYSVAFGLAPPLPCGTGARLSGRWRCDLSQRERVGEPLPRLVPEA